MAGKPIDLPPQIASAFVEDMKAFYAEENFIKRDEIAARQLSILNEYRGRREEPLRVSDIKKVFRELKGIVG